MSAAIGGQKDDIGHEKAARASGKAIDPGFKVLRRPMTRKGFMRFRLSSFLA